MSTRTTCSGLETVEFDPDDTLDIELTALPTDDLADQWEQLADAYAANEHCPGCMWDERGFNAFTRRAWHEGHCTDPHQCVAINPRAVANAFRKQAS